MRVTWQPPTPECSPAPDDECIVPATVRPDWTLPAPPTDEPDTWHPSAYDTGDGWLMEWRRNDENDDGDYPMTGETAWPFVEDYAYASDWRGLGFEVC